MWESLLSIKMIGDKIKIGRRGSINFYLKVRGIQGHTANGHRAENPIHYLVKLINNLISEPLDQGKSIFFTNSNTSSNY